LIFLSILFIIDKGAERKMDKHDCIIQCWHCQAEYDLLESSFCNHPAATKICPFCLHCYCDADDNYKQRIENMSPHSFQTQKHNFKKKQDMKLGEILVNAGKISEEKLKELITIQKQTSKKLGEILIQLNLISREELTIFLMEQASIETTNLERESIDFHAVFTLGRTNCIKKNIIPFEITHIGSKKILRLGINSKENLLKLKLDQELSEYILIPYLLSDEDINTAIIKIRDYKTDLMLLE
jgi:hypothetical protein